ncbi:hypothetical protein D3C85_1808150 [compost metagenome]
MSLITALQLRVLSSTTTMADSLFLALHTENHTSSPPLLYSGCTTRLAPSSASLAQAATSITCGPLARLLMS